jgi:hypothetical protein
MKFLRPVFKALKRAAAAGRLADGGELATRVFEQHGRKNYHPIAAKMVAADLGLQP